MCDIKKFRYRTLWHEAVSLIFSFFSSNKICGGICGFSDDAIESFMNNICVEVNLPDGASS